MKASNCISNLRGIDRDEAVANSCKLIGLPSAEDLDRAVEEEKICEQTTSSVNVIRSVSSEGSD